jgi:hypothetical protein
MRTCRTGGRTAARVSNKESPDKENEHCCREPIRVPLPLLHAPSSLFSVQNLRPPHQQLPLLQQWGRCFSLANYTEAALAPSPRRGSTSVKGVAFVNTKAGMHMVLQIFRFLHSDCITLNPYPNAGACVQAKFSLSTGSSTW